MKAKVLACVSLFSILFVSSAHSLPLIPEFRPRVGMGFSPDQFVVGAQAFMRGRLLGLARLAPSVDVGFGDNVTTTVINLDLLSGTLSVGKGVGLYAGAGASYAFSSGNGNSDSDFGATIVAGADLGERFFAEARFGLDKMPDVRLLAGIRLIKK